MAVLAAFEHVAGVEDAGGVLGQRAASFALLVAWCGHRIRLEDLSVVLSGQGSVLCP